MNGVRCFLRRRNGESRKVRMSFSGLVPRVPAHFFCFFEEGFVGHPFLCIFAVVNR